MHFLFPHLSARYSVAPISEIRRKVALAIVANLALVLALSLPVAIFGRYILTMWIGAAFGQQPPLMFPTIVCGFALLGINVTAHYALLAIGQVRIVTYLNLLAGVVMLFLMAMLIPNHGLQGAALARLSYGPITCLAYFYVYRAIWRFKPTISSSQSPVYETAAISTD
jgi:O-antigen/teichoic acid export membrane protein